MKPPPWAVRSANQRGGGDQLVAQLFLAVAPQEGEQPVGEVGGAGGVGGPEEFDDPQLGIGHGRSPLGSNGSRSPALGVVYVLIVSTRSVRLQPVRWRETLGPTDGLTCP